MRKTLLAAMTVVGCLVFAGPAMAWTYEDCVKVNFDHPDCDQYKPPETPPETPPVTPPVAPPVVTPPVVTPPSVTPPSVVAPPVAPPEEEEAPPEEYEIIDVPAGPDLPKKASGEAGKTERRDKLNIPAAPQVQTVSSTDNGELPYTGWPSGLGALLGAGLMGGGALMRRRNR